MKDSFRKMATNQYYFQDPTVAMERLVGEIAELPDHQTKLPQPVQTQQQLIQQAPRITRLSRETVNKKEKRKTPLPAKQVLTTT